MRPETDHLVMCWVWAGIAMAGALLSADLTFIGICAVISAIHHAAFSVVRVLAGTSARSISLRRAG